MAIARYPARSGSYPPARNAAPVLIGLLVIVGAVSVLRSRHVVAHAPAGTAPVQVTANIQAVTGLATFYADDFDGRQMANGAIFHMDDPTIAAANRWPLGTRLRLRRVPGSPWDEQLTPAERTLYFGRSVEVTVTDRGAFTHELDLSRGAFALLGRPREGVLRVSIEVIDQPARVADVANRPAEAEASYR